MIDYELKSLYNKNSVDKQISIKFDGGEITNKELHLENFELTESICSQSELRFGGCEASIVKFRVSNIFEPLKGKWLDISETLNGNTDKPFQIGKYKVFSDVLIADKRYRDIVAYDKMYDIINAEVSEWYNSLIFPMTLKNFRNSFFAYFGVEQEVIVLPNDDMVVENTINPSQLSAKTVISCICEINGCFGRIGRDGKFKYVFLPTYENSIYPSDDLFPSETLFPVEARSESIGNNYYIECKYEDFTTETIDKVQIRKSENDIGAVVGTGNNCYVIQDNFLVYGKSTEDLTQIANTLLRKISGISYRPFSAKTLGNPCLEPGDAVRLSTKYEIVQSYILQRTLKGIQALKDTISSNGIERYSEKVNSVSNDIVQLKGKTNELERTVEETKSMITDEENGLKTQITQTKDSITTEVTRAKNAEEILSSRIEQTVKSISLQVNNGEKTAGIVIKFTDEKGNEKKATGTVEMTGVVTFKDISEEGQTVINGSNITTGTINCNLLNGGVINGQSIKGGTVEGSTITGGVFRSEGGNYLTEIASGIATTTLIRLIAPDITGFTPGISRLNQEQTATISGLYFPSDGKVVVDAPLYVGFNGVKNAYMKSAYSSGCVLGVESCRPIEDGEATSGKSSYRWSAVYAKDGEIQTSDKNSKKDFEGISEQYENMFFKLNPLIYKFKDGIRKHSGFVSQEVMDAMSECGLTDLDFAGFCKDKKTEFVIDENGDEVEKLVLDENGNEQYIYSLRYSEFIALNTHMIQQAYKKIESQQEEIDKLKKSVSFLMEKLGGVKDE